MFQIHIPEPTAIDYATVAAVHNAVWRDEPITIEQIRHFDESWPTTYLSQRLNEENNPMYQLNLQLGFTPLPAALTMKKVFG